MADFMGVSDEFEGAIVAQGLTIPITPDEPAPPIEDRIRWIREDNGALVAEMFVFESSAFGVKDWRARLDTVLENQFRLEHNPADTADQRATASGGGERRTIIAGDGSSSFLQLLPAVAARAIRFGTAIIPGGAPSSTVMVSHGLGRVPLWVGINPSTSNVNTSSPAAGWTSTQFRADATDIRAVGDVPVNMPIQWVAIG